MADINSDTLKITEEIIPVDFVELSRLERTFIIDTLTTLLAYVQRRGGDVREIPPYVLERADGKGTRQITIRLDNGVATIVETSDQQTVLNNFEVNMATSALGYRTEGQQELTLLNDDEMSYQELTTLSRIVFDVESHDRHTLQPSTEGTLTDNNP